MTMMDERLAERRRGVSEDRARRRLRWVIIAIVTVLVVAGGAWLVRSPLLSIGSVDVSGAERSNPLATVEDLSMGTGTPTIDVRAGEIEQAIEVDAWVADATVVVSWPGSIRIDVLEHTPVAVASNSDGSMLVSADGSVIEPVSEARSLPSIEAGSLMLVPGTTSTDPLFVGAVAFAIALPDDRRAGAVISIVDGSLRATVDGHAVRLGRPNDLALKAAVLDELLAQGLTPGASIDLIAPTRPAIRNPQPQLEAEE